MAVFMGDHDKRIDAKRRVLVPAEFRAGLAREGVDAIVVVPEPKQPYLRAQTVEEFENILKQLKSTHGRFSQKRARASRYLFGRARTLSFDPEGRIMLPQKFCEHASLVKDVVFMGCGDHVQIWAAEALQADFDGVGEDEDGLLEDLEELGTEGEGA